MNKNKNKGFTLIELLVVIAIIGILASVVLASLTNARQKGKIAAIQSTLSSMRAQAEIGVTNGRYVKDVCKEASAKGGLAALMDSLNLPSSKVVKLKCGSDATGATATVLPLKWIAEASILVNNVETFYCVDYTGYSGLSKGPSSGGTASATAAAATTARSATPGTYTAVYGLSGSDLLCSD